MPLYSGYPALRQNNHADQTVDTAIVSWMWKHRWSALDTLLYERDRQIEDNVRMLCGQHWHFFVERLNRYVSVDDYLTDEEKRWRQRPVFNRVLIWFLHNHARMTENQPIIGFLPGPDRVDAELAEVLDTVMKTMWRDADMLDVIERVCAWLLPGGMAHTYSRIDWTQGEWREFVADAVLPMVGLDGQPMLHPNGEPMTQQVPGVPHGANLKPLVQLTPNGLQPLVHPETGQPLPTTPHSEREGIITVDVLSPLEVRGEWGPSPWHQKRWHSRVRFLSVEQVAETWGVEVKADPNSGTTGDPGMLDRLLFGTGYYGAATRRFGTGAEGGNQSEARDGYVRVLETWERPCNYPGMEERKEQPGGRLTVLTHDTVLQDGPRSAAFRYVSPIRTYEFLRIPGRQGGSTPQEFINSPVRAGNRLMAHELEHTALQAHPKGLILRGSGLEQTTITNKPGEHHLVNPSPAGQSALTYVAPPPLSNDLYRTRDALERFIREMGSTQESPGESPQRDASGELIKELRWDRDREIGPTMRRFMIELGRQYEDWLVLMPYVFTTERLLSYAGEDNVAQVVWVRPYLFQQGKVNVVADMESMAPEGRGEKQSRITWLYSNGLFGAPGSPEAIGKFFELGRFPHLSRAAKPGGIDRTTAEQNLGAILQGTPAAQIPLYPWYDMEVHLRVYRDFMAGPQFKKQDPAIQGELVLLWQVVDQQVQAARMAQQAQEMAMASAHEPPHGGPPGKAPGRGATKQAEKAGSKFAVSRSGPLRAAEQPPALQESAL